MRQLQHLINAALALLIVSAVLLVSDLSNRVRPPAEVDQQLSVDTIPFMYVSQSMVEINPEAAAHFQLKIPEKYASKIRK